VKEAVKRYMACISSNNDRHPISKTSTSLHLSTLHFFPFKLYPSTLHYTSLPSHYPKQRLAFWCT